jgi:hypothetical protein
MQVYKYNRSTFFNKYSCLVKHEFYATVWFSVVLLKLEFLTLIFSSSGTVCAN